MRHAAAHLSPTFEYVFGRMPNRSVTPLSHWRMRIGGLLEISNFGAANLRTLSRCGGTRAEIFFDYEMSGDWRRPCGIAVFRRQRGRHLDDVYRSARCALIAKRRECEGGVAEINAGGSVDVSAMKFAGNQYRRNEFRLSGVKRPPSAVFVGVSATHNAVRIEQHQAIASRVRRDRQSPRIIRRCASKARA